MSAVPPLASIAVGVVVERSKSASQWADFYWRPAGVLAGAPETPPWTKLNDDGERASFYAGSAAIELYRTETANYRDNLATWKRRCCGSSCGRSRPIRRMNWRRSRPIRPKAKP